MVAMQSLERDLRRTTSTAVTLVPLSGGGLAIGMDCLTDAPFQNIPTWEPTFTSYVWDGQRILIRRQSAAGVTFPTQGPATCPPDALKAIATTPTAQDRIMSKDAVSFSINSPQPGLYESEILVQAPQEKDVIVSYHLSRSVYLRNSL